MKEKDHTPEKDNVIFLHSFTTNETGIAASQNEQTQNEVPMYVVKGDGKKNKKSLQENRKDIFLRIVK